MRTFPCNSARFAWLAVSPASGSEMEGERLAVTVREAVILTGIGRSKLYAMFKEGDLRAKKAGRRTLVLVADLKRMLKSLPDAR